MPYKFTVGDRVKVTSDRYGAVMWQGRIGHIARVHDGYYVRFRLFRNTIWFEAADLEAAPAKARKKRGK